MVANDPAQRFNLARYNMVQQQIRPWEVIDERVLDIMQEIARDHFVPDAYIGLAYADIEVPLGHGQHMMFPRVEARMLQALAIKPSDRVLEIGTGSGYVTACLARLAKHVTSVEIHDDLAATAGRKLDEMGVHNLNLIAGDITEITPEGAPFDVIAVTGSLPSGDGALRELLADGGRMFIIEGRPPAMEAKLIQRVHDEVYQSQNLFETDVAPLENTGPAERFEF